MMMIEVRLPFLDSLGHMSYSTAGDAPVFLNGDLVNAIGRCQMLDEGEMAAILWLDVEVGRDMFVYYLRDVGRTDCFHFAGLVLREKRLRRVRWKESKVIAMPRFEIGREKRCKRLGDVVVWGL